MEICSKLIKKRKIKIQKTNKKILVKGVSDIAQNRFCFTFFFFVLEIRIKPPPLKKKKEKRGGKMKKTKEN